MSSDKQQKRYKRHKRIRSKISGTSLRPRLSVFRSNKHIYAQLIDDEKSKVLLSSKDNLKSKKNKTEKAREVGKEIASLAKTKKIEKVVFDRGGYNYQGRIKALAEAAREGGLKF